MPYYPLSDLIFFDVPKSGTTSVKEWIRGGVGRPEAECGEAHMLPEEYISKGVITSDEFNRASKLIVVRNVFDRIASAYRAADGNGDFEYFLSKMLSNTFKPYSYSIMDYLIGGSEIVRFDELRQRFPGIRHINKTVRRSAKNPYTAKTIEAVKEGYGQEIRQFGWKYEESEGVRLSN